MGFLSSHTPQDKQSSCSDLLLPQRASLQEALLPGWRGTPSRAPEQAQVVRPQDDLPLQFPLQVGNLGDTRLLGSIFPSLNYLV